MNYKEIFTKLNSSNDYLVIPSNLRSRMVQLKTEYEIKNRKLLLFNVITVNELIDLLSFKIDNESYLYNLQNYNRPLSVTKEMFNFSKYNLKKSNEALNKFINENKQFIIKNNLFIEKLNDYSFYILGNDVFLKPFIDYYKLNTTNIDFKTNHQPKILKFITKEEEIFYMFEEISKLLDKGFDINKIYLSNVNNSYYNDIMKLSKFYNIPINLNIVESLIDIPYIKTIMEKSYNDILSLLNNKEGLREKFLVERQVNSYEFDSNINKLINVFNRYPHSNYKQEVVLSIIKEDLKNTNIKNTVITNNAVTLISTEEIIGLNDDEKVFVLNTTYESFPNIVKDNDYLSDSDKNLINYPNSSTINISNNRYLEEIISLNNIVYLSFSVRDNYLEYTSSDITTKLINEEEDYIKLNINDISKGYATNYYKSIFSNRNSDILQTTFTGEFILTNDEKSELIRNLKQKEIKISPSQVTTYYKLPFIYYLERILGFNTFTESISLHIGNFFHSIVEVLMLLLYENKVDRSNLTGNKKFSYDDEIHEMIFNYIVKKDEDVNDNFDYSLFFDEFIQIYFSKELSNYKTYKNNKISKKNELIIKTIFYVKKHKKVIVNALILIADLEKEVPSVELLMEREIELSNFKGQADLVKIYSDNKYSIIDYKSGTREAFDKDKIIDLVDTLLLENNDEISFGSLDLLQLVLYSYFFYKDRPELELKDLAYYSFFTNRLNGMTTEQSFDSTHYNKGRGKGRYIEKQELKQLFTQTEKLLDKTLKNIKRFEFPVEIRRDSKTKAGMDKSYYSVYEALAFYNDNNLQEDEDDEN